MKHERRNGHALSSTTTGLEVYKQTWWCFLATQEMYIPLGTVELRLSERLLSETLIIRTRL